MKRILIVLLLFVRIASSFAVTWTYGETVDAFGDPTGDFGVYTENLNGTFSNLSGSTGESLKFRVEVYNDGKVQFQMFEKGKDANLSTAMYTSDTYSVQIKVDDGSVKTFTGSIGKRNAYNMILIGSGSDILPLFLQNKAIKVIISNDRGSYSLGSIDLTTFMSSFFKSPVLTMYENADSDMKGGNYQAAMNLYENLKSIKWLSYVFPDLDKQISTCENAIRHGLNSKCIYSHTFENGKCSICGFIQVWDVGDIGPAGGYIFYDCDADNSSGNTDGLRSSECGWRYLEAAPSDVIVGSVNIFVFGYHRTSSDGKNLYVNGMRNYDVSTCTGTAVGTGKANTQKLVAAMGSSAYRYLYGKDKTSSYAAKIADDYSIALGGVTYDNWFLPSKDELDLMYTVLKKVGLGNFSSDSYWSSSEEDSGLAETAWEQNFSDGYQYSDYYYGSRSSSKRVRCIRAF